MSNKLTELILDILFPITCVFCQKENRWICPNCLDRIKISSFQVCFHCEKNITENGKLCEKCKNYFLNKGQSFPLDALIVSSSYQKNGISRLVHLYKYNFIRDLSFPLGNLLTQSIIKSNLPIPDLIIPVPLHQRRLRWRGFNQAKELADFVGKNLAPGFPIPVEDEVVLRRKHTPPQMKIKSHKERKLNVSEAFLIKKEKKVLIATKTVLLIDDIATTGATLFEIGRLLKKNDVKRVFAAVIARQEIK